MPEDTSILETESLDTSMTQEPAQADTSVVVSEPESNVKTDAETKENAQDWFKKDKYKTVEEQAKAYSELERKYTQVSQARAEETKKLRANDLQQQETTLSKQSSELERTYQAELSSISEIKASTLKTEVKALRTQGADENYIDNYIAERSKQLDGFAKEREQQLVSKFNQYKVKIDTDLKDFVEKEYKDIEENFKDDLQNPVYKNAFDEYKKEYPYPNAKKHFTDFLLPLLKKTIELHEVKKIETAQLLKEKNKIKDAQTGSGGAGGSSSSHSTSTKSLPDNYTHSQLKKWLET